ncbi:ABC transporter permease [Bacillus sp. 1P06AnD]|uniref:ABC transporter permease n=1 Tax=Bacillus sp. 1P06AnD TaxID=3132208 RepID=UPI0039A3EE53
MFKNKLFIITPIIAILITFIFAVVQIPAAKQAPKHVPIALVNEDLGVDIPNKGNMNFGKTMIDRITKQMKKTNGEDEPAIKWVTVSSYKKAKEGMDDKEYYGALLIPKDYSAKQASLQTPAPSSPELKIYINQGKNAVASTVVTQLLNGIVDNMNNQMKGQLLEGYKTKNEKITIEQATVLASPIAKTVTYVNESGTKGSVPMSLFQPIWMGSLLSAVLLWTAQRKREYTSKKQKLATISMQVFISAIAAFFIGYGLTWLADGMLGYEMSNFADTALFLTLTSFSFILMILAVLMWIGLAGMPIFVLLLFFGAPLLAMAPEFMPSFYKEWIFSWLPMRFMVEGLQDVFFFGKGLSWSQPISVLVWIGLGSLVVLFLSTLKSNVKQEKISVKQMG